LSDVPHTRLRYFCSPHHRDSPFHPFIAQLERAAGLAREDAPQAKLDKLETLVSLSGRDLAETAPFFADLLALISAAPIRAQAPTRADPGSADPPAGSPRQ